MNKTILKPEKILMITILITAFVIRILNIRYGYPLQTHPDEPVLVNAALNMINTGDLNPHNFQYPSLNIYLQALLFFVLQLPAKLFGVQLFPAQLIDFHVYARVLNGFFRQRQFILYAKSGEDYSALGPVLLQCVSSPCHPHTL